MFCPACGEKGNTEQSFCRSCGMNLADAAASVREQFPDGGIGSLELEERKLERFGGIAFTGLGIVVASGVIAIIYGVFENMVLSGRRPYTGVLLMAFIFFAALSLAYVFWNESLKDKRKKRAAAELVRQEGRITTGKLTDGATFEPVSSVTERTTSLLEQPSRKESKTGKIS